MKTFPEYLAEASGHTVYYRGTNNSNEDQLVKSRQLRPSLNHITNKRERGISVSDVPDVGKYFDFMYMLTGTEVGEGADGEPLLDPNTVEFIKWVKK